MAAPLSPESQALLKMLAGGEWTDLQYILAKLAAAVAPGKALRRYHQNETNRQRHNGPRKGPELIEDDQIASGRRAIATDAVNSLKKRYVEIRDVDGVRQIRRRPQIVPIADPRAVQVASLRHDPAVVQPEPPDDTPPEQDEPALPEQDDPDPGDDPEPGKQDELAPARALMLTEAQLRALVGAEVGAALDNFQHGMQRWLAGCFVELQEQLDRGRHRPRPPGQKHLPRELRRR